MAKHKPLKKETSPQIQVFNSKVETDKQRTRIHDPKIYPHEISTLHLIHPTAINSHKSQTISTIPIKHNTTKFQTPTLSLNHHELHRPQILPRPPHFLTRNPPILLPPQTHHPPPQVHRRRCSNQPKNRWPKPPCCRHRRWSSWRCSSRNTCKRWHRNLPH